MFIYFFLRKNQRKKVAIVTRIGHSIINTQPIDFACSFQSFTQCSFEQCSNDMASIGKRKARTAYQPPTSAGTYLFDI